MSVLYKSTQRNSRSTALGTCRLTTSRELICSSQKSSEIVSNSRTKSSVSRVASPKLGRGCASLRTRNHLVFSAAALLR